MFEKVNPEHPDKQMDKIAGAIVDLAYKKNDNPKIAVEGLIGHKKAFIIIESSETFTKEEIVEITKRISNIDDIELLVVPQDKQLANNQEEEIRCGDNGIFKGTPITEEEKKLTEIAKYIYSVFKCDGKYILDKDKLIICQSNAPEAMLRKAFPEAIINPLGFWTGSTDVDTGAVNRKQENLSRYLVLLVMIQ